MRTPETRDHSGLIVNQITLDAKQTMIDPPKRALVTTETYGQGVRVFERDVIARAGRWLCVRQNDEGWGEWLAWVEETDCEPFKG